MRRIIQKPRTLAERSLPRFVLATLVAGTLLVPASATHAAGTPEQTCQQGLYRAAAQYSACQQKALAKFFGGGAYNKLQAATSKCRVKYTSTWPKLQAKAPGSTCDTTRFTDNGTTVTDNLTGLQWEKKQNLDSTQNFADPHDADNVYSWSAAPPFLATDGTVFTTFLPTLNSGGCFAGLCDWRLPTIYELQTILLEAYPCATYPCIDPVFGPTVADGYWSATTDATYPVGAWGAFFGSGYMDGVAKSGFLAVRAVRAGL